MLIPETHFTIEIIVTILKYCNMATTTMTAHRRTTILDKEQINHNLFGNKSKDYLQAITLAIKVRRHYYYYVSN